MTLSLLRFPWLATLLAGLLCLGSRQLAAAHPMPNSVVLLAVHAHRIDATVQIPLTKLQPAFGHAVGDSSAGLVRRLGPELRAYLTQHIRLQSPDGRYWAVLVGQLGVHATQNPLNGPYRELMAQVGLLPPAGADVRRFVLRYDAVLHQVVTHKILVAGHQDWAAGQVADDAESAQVGIIQLDVVDNLISPLAVNLTTGSAWTGLRAMVQLGIRHIAEGTDHLLFLLVLLPAPLLVAGRRWGPAGSVRYGLRRLLLIVTAFTLGHSLTLLLGTLGWVQLPSQPVEILIAVSILVSAAHAWRPLFPGRETWVAAGFGLVHGLWAGARASFRRHAGQPAPGSRAHGPEPAGL